MELEVLDIPNIQRAREEIANVKASPVSIPLMADKCVFKVIKLRDLSTTAANILKQEFLSKGGEVAVSENTVNSRDKYTDVIMMGTIRQYKEVIKKLKIQPLNLPELAKKLEEIIKTS
ncbi:dihydropteroate synthase [Anaerobranca californiensis DSM 14826]|uniref:Dihydropteroate synthase n=1 Tax=Anaerobranca californiensis DSM 14826 TaxID=1120989 RepID=A0A1M6Q5Q8_9FIRM|nr:hypothetical protein [Anaerobranca californiensis]SHK15463.1 dihydropteroate synthase [Anaerobranca californiensis DSM 14826]